MAKDDPAETKAGKKEPTREEILAVTEADNAARAMDGHKFPDSTIPTGE